MAREKQNDLTVEKKKTNRLHKKQNRRKRKKIDHKGIKKRHIVSIITLRIAKKSQWDKFINTKKKIKKKKNGSHMLLKDKCMYCAS